MRISSVLAAWIGSSWKVSEREEGHGEAGRRGGGEVERRGRVGLDGL